ncbi:hypothetical protein ASJ36_03955 [Aeromonas sp. ARM81]|nr:hypothetical protein ACH48_19980 [Aeromonas caviae]PNO60345.1 hypothetical protein MC65_019540 [Aeromonas caviae]RDD51289.1 hypothetical protein ASJ36_03955 [Aeromonas sp. ARM81]
MFLSLCVPDGAPRREATMVAPPPNRTKVPPAFSPRFQPPQCLPANDLFFLHLLLAMQMKINIISNLSR